VTSLPDHIEMYAKTDETTKLHCTKCGMVSVVPDWEFVTAKHIEFSHECKPALPRGEGNDA